MSRKVSVVINTLNEESNIADCIRSVQALADEVVVCDMHSDDRTVEIAKNLGARVIYHEHTGFVEPARYYAISQASFEWVLVLDADERMTQRLSKKLREIAQKDAADVVSFWSLYWYFGGWVRHGRFFSGNWPRFFRKRVYLETYNSDEEIVHHNFRGVGQHPNKLQLSSDYHIHHLAYPTIEKYVYKTLGKYARLEAEQMYQAGQHFRIWQLILDPLKSFVKSFILLEGFRDGLRGFILTVLHSVFRFNIWANLWLLEETGHERSLSEKKD